MARHTTKKRLKVRVFPVFILLVIIIVLVYKSMTIPEGRHLLEENPNDKNGQQSLNIESKSGSYVSISSDSLHSSYAILIRLNDNSILMEKKSEEKIFPASLTKMMTAIVAIENLPNLKEEIKLTHYTFDGLYSANAAMAGFQPGEKVKAIDLLYGVLLPSGAESCIGLADQIAGSEQDFVSMMNQKAADLGMVNTHFTNSIGLHNENHYTTVKDLAILLRYALQNDIFKDIFTSSRHSTQSTNKNLNGITFKSTMFEKLGEPSITGGKILGGKTGYTEEAGLCLASLAEVGKKEYILITTGAKGNSFSEQYNIIDALTVYESLGKE